MTEIDGKTMFPGPGGLSSRMPNGEENPFPDCGVRKASSKRFCVLHHKKINVTVLGFFYVFFS